MALSPHEIVSTQPLRDWCVMSEEFSRWTRYNDNETSDDEASATDDWDENIAAGSVQGLHGHSLLGMKVSRW